jgi:AcrR family transcriptional regulator
VDTSDRDVRARLLAAIEQILVEHGTSQVSLREVARRAGVSHATPGHYFANKRGMLTAYAALAWARLGSTVTEGIAAARPPDGPALLATIGNSYVRFAVQNPEMFRLMFNLDELDAEDPAFRAASDAAYAALASTVARCVAEGRCAPEQAETVIVASWSLVHGLAGLWISGRLRARLGERDPEVLAAAVCDFYVSSCLR